MGICLPCLNPGDDDIQQPDPVSVYFQIVNVITISGYLLILSLTKIIVNLAHRLNASCHYDGFINPEKKPEKTHHNLILTV